MRRASSASPAQSLSPKRPKRANDATVVAALSPLYVPYLLPTYSQNLELEDLLALSAVSKEAQARMTKELGQNCENLTHRGQKCDAKDDDNNNETFPARCCAPYYAANLAEALTWPQIDISAANNSAESHRLADRQMSVRFVDGTITLYTNLDREISGQSDYPEWAMSDEDEFSVLSVVGSPRLVEEVERWLKPQWFREIARSVVGGDGREAMEVDLNLIATPSIAEWSSLFRKVGPIQTITIVLALPATTTGNQDILLRNWWLASSLRVKGAQSPAPDEMKVASAVFQ